MNWTVIRVAFIYLPVFAASLAAAAGYGSYDSATGIFTPNAIDVHAVAEKVRDYGAILASGVASLAAWKGWGRK